MEDLNDKLMGGTLTSDEWNQVPSELQNVIGALGIALLAGDLNQLGKAIAGMCGASTWYSESGAADAYVCNVVGAKHGPVALDAVHDGLIVRFRPGNANTGASTINVNSLGVVDIKREDGSALSAGDLVTTRDAFLRWDNASGDFFLLDFSR